MEQREQKCEKRRLKKKEKSLAPPKRSKMYSKKKRSSGKEVGQILPESLHSWRKGVTKIHPLTFWRFLPHCSPMNPSLQCSCRFCWYSLFHCDTQQLNNRPYLHFIKKTYKKWYKSRDHFCNLFLVKCISCGLIRLIECARRLKCFI